MADSPHTCVKMEEVVPLQTVPTSGETCNQVTSSGRGVASCCDDKHHRKLAICSIICGISCIGIKALINSVKVFCCLTRFFSHSSIKMSKPSVARLTVWKNVSSGEQIPQFGVKFKFSWSQDFASVSGVRQLKGKSSRVSVLKTKFPHCPSLKDS